MVSQRPAAATARRDRASIGALLPVVGALSVASLPWSCFHFAKKRHHPSCRYRSFHPGSPDLSYRPGLGQAAPCRSPFRIPYSSAVLKNKGFFKLNFFTMAQSLHEYPDRSKPVSNMWFASTSHAGGCFTVWIQKQKAVFLKQLKKTAFYILFATYTALAVSALNTRCCNTFDEVFLGEEEHDNNGKQCYSSARHVKAVVSYHA